MGIALERLTAIGIDPKTTGQRFLGKTEFHVRMLRSFASEDAPKKLEDALAGGDFKEVEHVGRSIKGSAANLGFLPLSDACVNLVKAARSEDAAAVQAFGAEVLEKTRAAYAGIASLPEI